jgi:hypothetical protein
MATERQKQAARRNLEKARKVQGARARGKKIPKMAPGLSTHDQNRLRDADFAFPHARKEPLTDARHVRNAVARFNQVEGVTDAQRDRAWRRIQAAARKFGVELHEGDWRELAGSGRRG